MTGDEDGYWQGLGPVFKELTVSWGNRCINKTLQLSVMRAVIKLGIQVVLPQRFIHFSFIHLFIHFTETKICQDRGVASTDIGHNGYFRELSRGAGNRYEQIISKYKLWQSVEGMVGQARTERGQLM